MNQSITVLRFIASFIVVLYHYFYRYFERKSIEGFDNFIFGKIGVEMFFLLSGYLLISSISKYSPKTFIIKRIRRIFPTYIVGMIITMTVVSLFSDKSFSPLQIVANMTMLNVPLGISSIDGVYWTLFIELCFYGLLFFLALVGKDVPKVFISISMVSFILRSCGCDGVLLSIMSVFTYGWLFAGGASLRLYTNTNTVVYIFLAGIFIAGYAFFTKLHLTQAVILFITAGFIVLSDRMKRIRFPRVLVYLGSISYPIYLIHQEIGYIMFELLGWNILTLVLNFTLIIFLSGVLHKYVETKIS